MYLALFMTPWVLMYALSTFVMNHRTWFRGKTPAPPPFQLEREVDYPGDFPPGATPAQKAVQLLNFLDMDGAHSVGRSGADGSFVVNRQDAVAPRRITYHPASGKVTIERQEFQTSAFLERMHRRRGFQQAYALDYTWGGLVDLFIVTTIFWALSGLWLWWELKVTRVTGLLFALGGIGLFTLFLAAI
jgi:hypothetical protein